MATQRISFQDLLGLVKKYKTEESTPVDENTDLDKIHVLDLVDLFTTLEDRLDIVLEEHVRNELQTVRCLFEALNKLGVAVTEVVSA